MCVCVSSNGDLLATESDQEAHESELADHSLFVQELFLLAVTSADEGLIRENLPSDAPEIPSSAAATQQSQQSLLNSVAKPTTNSDAVVNCSSKTSYLRAKNSSSLLRSAAAAAGNSQRHSAPNDTATLPGAKR